MLLGKFLLLSFTGLLNHGTLVEGGEGSYLPNCQTNLVIALYTLSPLLFCKFKDTTAYQWPIL